MLLEFTAQHPYGASQTRALLTVVLTFFLMVVDMLQGTHHPTACHLVVTLDLQAVQVILHIAE
jgi:hypothetical protein